MKATKLTTLLLLFILAGALTYCSKKDALPPTPTASFTYTGAGLAPAMVSFTNTSTDATSYLWDFGDNGKSTDRSPTHTYNKAGVYTVTLTAKGADGSSSITTKTVNILAPTSVKVVAIKLSGMSFTDAGGGGWDASTGPDVYCTFSDANEQVLLSGAVHANVTASALPVGWTNAPAFQVSDLSATYKLRVYDKDIDDLPPSPDDFIGGYSFSFAAYAAAGYPTVVPLQTSGSPLKLELQLQWQ
jgi:PKD repeat protein